MSIKNKLLPEMKVERYSLKDQAAAHLREMIVSGRVAPGARITERDVADWLNISRMPARDALMVLENEGLIITRQDGRHVIELTELDVQHLYELRRTMEKLAVELACAKTSPVNQQELNGLLAEMRHAIESGDMASYSASDLKLHEAIWKQAGNPYLLDMLSSMIGPIFMLIASQADITEDWRASQQLHEQLVADINGRDILAAVQSMETHMSHSYELAMAAYKK